MLIQRFWWLHQAAYADAAALVAVCADTARESIDAAHGPTILSAPTLLVDQMLLSADQLLAHQLLQVACTPAGPLLAACAPTAPLVATCAPAAPHVIACADLPHLVTACTPAVPLVAACAAAAPLMAACGSIGAAHDSTRVTALLLQVDPLLLSEDPLPAS